MNTSFDINEKQWADMLKIEEDTNCDIDAGRNYGQNTSAYLSLGKAYIDRKKLLSLLHERLEAFLTIEAIEAIADDLMAHTADLVEAKLQDSTQEIVKVAVK